MSSPFHACLFLTAVSFISLTNWDNHLVQSVNEKSNFTSFASDSNLKTVNSEHFEALLTKVAHAVSCKYKNGLTVCNC